ncbi:MAG: hypothetical protein H7122_03465 [Chitinophagaceae bacterium]|nr:hypothetical protein [Chitinophagaceae bacterium]
MRIIFCVLLVYSRFDVMSQELEFRDYRTKKESFTKIPEKDVRADIASFAVGGIDESIGKLPLTKIGVSKHENNFMSFESNNIKVIITTVRFEPSQHKLVKDEEHVVKIDNKPYYGNYGEVPGNHIQSLIILIDKDTIPVPLTAYADLCNVNFTYRDKSGTERSNNGIYLSKDNRKVYVYLMNKDGEGGYEATWVIQDKKFLRRVLDYGMIK